MNSLAIRRPDLADRTAIQRKRKRERRGLTASAGTRSVATGIAIVRRISPARELLVLREPPPPNYRDAVCDLCEKTVSLALDLPLTALQAKTRQSPEIALGRQIAMYLSNTMFGIAFSEVGLHFNRDRTTVSHACGVVEDKRDDLSFDVMICQLEALLTDARDAVLSSRLSDEREG